MNVQMMRTSRYAGELVVAYEGDAGIDLPILGDWVISPGEGMDVRTGWAMALPEGYYGRIVGRSSAFRRKGVMVVEGTIDCQFRGELFSYVYNPGDVAVDLREGESVAQLIVSPIPIERRITVVDELPVSVRGVKGFGSSGR